MIDDPEYNKTKLYLKTTLLIDEASGHKLPLFAHRTTHQGNTGRPNRDFNHEYMTLNGAYQLPLTQRMTTHLKIMKPGLPS